MPASRPRILVVDDDLALRRVVARVLKGQFEVTEAEDGASALALVEAGEHFDVVVTDVEMPGMDGCALVDRLGEITPELADRVVIMTGGPFDPRLAAWVQEFPRGRVITKPIAVGKLVAAIEKVLGRRV